MRATRISPRDFDALLIAKREEEEDVAAAVRGIIADVRARGDAALIELTNKFDQRRRHHGDAEAVRRRDRRRGWPRSARRSWPPRDRRGADRELSPPPAAEG